MKHIGVIGAGAWGTAMACVAARAGDPDTRKVTLWALEPEVVQSVNEQHLNQLYLPDIELEGTITATSDFADFKPADAILMVAPAQHVRGVTRDLVTALQAPVPIAICAKGIERDTLKLMTEVVAEEAPGYPVAVLSGPSFAADVARGLPTAVTLACEDEAIGAALMEAIGISTFRPYQSTDLVGAELGGSVKNVLAIACGIVEGKKFGESARAALTARGFAEMVRLGEAMGAKSDTLRGLSGLGDLILTCNSMQSRNMSLGAALGEGHTLKQIMAARRSVAEGVHSAKAVVALAQKYNVEMPIVESVEAIVSGEKSVDDAIVDLLNRPFRAEH